MERLKLQKKYESKKLGVDAGEAISDGSGNEVLENLNEDSIAFEPANDHGQGI